MGMFIEELLGFLLVFEYLHNLYVILCLLVFSGPEYLAHETRCLFIFSDTCQCIMMVIGLWRAGKVDDIFLSRGNLE